MNLKIAAPIAAAALTAGLLVAAPAAHAAPILPSTFYPTYRADIDGDGRNDSINVMILDKVGTDSGVRMLWEITAKTAKGVRARTTLITDGSVERLATPVTFRSLDGAKGKELKFVQEDRRISAKTRVLIYTAFTWRSGKLVPEKAPDNGEASANTSLDWSWFTNNYATPTTPKAKDGYRFYTSHGYRYAEYFELDWNGSKRRWIGRIARSKWKSGRWYNNKRFTVSLTSTQAAKYVAIATAQPW